MTDAAGASYGVAIKRHFIAQHYLIGDASELEKQRHSHSYQVEVQLEGSTLNQQGYLVDIAELERHLEDVLAYYSDRTLNDLPEFRGINPSIEHLARILSGALSHRFKATNITALTVRVWESGNAWAFYRWDLSCTSA